MSRILRAIRRASRCTRGVTVIEFAIVAPVLMLLLMGLFDVAHTVYVKAQLNGLVQKAARDSTLQDQSTLAGQTALDNIVIAQVKALAPGATVSAKRRFYRNNNDATARVPEPWGDTNRDLRCNADESFTDTNGNGVWDADGGDGGSSSTTPGGGAQDRSIYLVTVTYPRLFPLWRFIGLTPQATQVATTILANQPYSDQASYAPDPATRHCP
jgi:Flp pilus assembly protein TadG